ncbi:MAG: CPBP family intramembrane metalloprotease [Peptostreptococcaceae bacterium]|nr:CPBP family intramembrane metalloprotease [Peptostreptococcaceae bacterium]
MTDITKNRWNLPQILRILVLIVVLPLTYNWLQQFFYSTAYLFGEQVLGYDYETMDTLYGNNTYFADAMFCIFASIIYLPWYIRVRHKERLLMIEPHQKKCDIKTIIKTVIITFGIGGISYIWLSAVDFVTAILETTGGEDVIGLGESLEEFATAFAPVDSEAYIWVFLSVVFLGPLVEELIFRGIQYYYAERIRRGWFAVLVTAISFGIWHGNFVQGVYTALMGIAIAIVYRHTRSILIPLLMHIINNFMAALPPALDLDIVYHAYDTICLIMILPTIYLLVRMAISDNRKEKEIRKKEFELMQKAYRESLMNEMQINISNTEEIHSLAGTQNEPENVINETVNTTDE